MLAFDFIKDASGRIEGTSLKWQQLGKAPKFWQQDILMVAFACGCHVGIKMGEKVELEDSPFLAIIEEGQFFKRCDSHKYTKEYFKGAATFRENSLWIGYAILDFMNKLDQRAGFKCLGKDEETEALIKHLEGL